ncbi:MAG: MerR family transcriptional regulator [Lachnospiraceae bacterium]|nr:MerR family transcriptional regulator [Lachnospiraceae bacterium]MCI9592084.1 MerR family transcriptional regulator [Lachnospiraceae bacterium]
MMSIKEAEKITGITNQNIRYYEKQGLLAPARRAENSYREYSQEDIRRLKLIKLFRKLGMPIGDIKRLLNGETTLKDAVALQKIRLETERETVTAALEFCEKIRESQLADLDEDLYLKEMEAEEKSKSVFVQFADDYITVMKAEMAREFSFMPDERCDTPEEFSQELLKYAKENNRNMVITKEGMAPDLMIDGVEYHAYRTSSRFGIVVHCKMIHQEDYFPKEMTEEKYRKYRAISLAALPVLIFSIMSLSVLWRNGAANAATWLMILVFGVMLIADMCFVYYCYGRNFQ